MAASIHLLLPSIILLPSPISKASSSLKNYDKLKSSSSHYIPLFWHLHEPIIIHSGKQKRGSFLRASSSDPIQESPPPPYDELIYENVAGSSTSSRLMSIMQIYKEAVVTRDVDTTSEIEALMCTLEKEKTHLVQKVSAMSADINSCKEKYIRLKADFDNFRKRSEKERLTVRSNAKGKVIESLLPMVDNFDRARHQLKLESEKEKSINASYQGIYKQLVEIMKSLQVAIVPTVGKPFDPSIHEAIAREESQEFKEGIIIQEVRRGFLLGDRILRPATVKVSSGPGISKGGDFNITSCLESASDHCKMVITLVQKLPCVPKPFRHQVFWEEYSEYATKVQAAWEYAIERNEMFNLHCRMNRVKQALKVFNSKHYSDLAGRVKAAADDLDHVQQE